MIEILWHGRGGQGAFTAARLLGAAAAGIDGLGALAFPSFGPERRGAPMRAFTKIAQGPIGNRSQIEQADFVVYLDDTLLGEGWDRELKPGGIVLVNSPRAAGDARILAVDASAISKRILGCDIPNTVFVALLCLLVEGLDAEAAKRAITENMPPKLHAGNLAVVDEVVARIADGTLAATGADAVVREVGLAAAGDQVTQAAPVVAERLIPTLRDDELDPAVYARSTCWEAGYLVSKNAGWRTQRPVVDDARCTGCWMCYMLCPDGTIFKTQEGTAAVDYDFCKGCGICAKACSMGAISMFAEGGQQ